MKLSTGVLCLLLLSAAFASTASAATAVRATIEQLSEKSVLVVRTKCLSVEARFTPDGSTIETHVVLERLESIVGKAPEKLTVLCRGGTVGDRSLKVPGQARFSVGEEDVVFLRKDPRGAWRVLGWCQGKFRVVRKNDTAAVEAVQDLAGLCFVKGKDETKPVSAKPMRLALADLVKRITTARPPVKDEPGTGDGDGAETPDHESEKKTPPAEDESGEEAGSGKK